MEVPPPFTNLQASREEEGGEQPGRRSLEGVGGVLELWGEFLSEGFHTRFSIFNHLCAVDWPACPMYQFSAELNERRFLQ